MSLADVLLLIFLVSWFLLSLLNQGFFTIENKYIRKLASVIFSIDILKIIPNWRFFAPNPKITDSWLLFRDKLDDETMTDWSHFEMGFSKRLHNIFWNPLLRPNKSIVDAIGALLHTYKREKFTTEELIFTAPYIFLLSNVSLLKKIKENSIARQFCITEVPGIPDEKSLVTFRSSFHDLL